MFINQFHQFQKSRVIGYCGITLIPNVLRPTQAKASHKSHMSMKRRRIYSHFLSSSTKSAYRQVTPHPKENVTTQ